MERAITEDEFIKAVADEMNYTKKWIAKRTAEKMRNKLMKVYDSIIDQFYSRHAEVYRRHGVDEDNPQTYGINLYNALQGHSGSLPTKYTDRPSYAPHTLDGGIYIDSKDMMGYNYQVPKDVVLEMIIASEHECSYRFPYKFPFTARYEDSECSASGTPWEVLESVRDQLSGKYADEALKEAKKELTLKYIKIK